MPIFGMKNPRATFVGIVATMRFEYDLHVRAKEGVYTIAPRFRVAGFVPPDDIVIHYHLLEGRNADYAGMARAYRNYQLLREVCKPISVRIKEQPELDYAARCPEIRIRQGWKPAPSPVMEQSLATEPPMKVAVTFDRVGDIPGRPQARRCQARAEISWMAGARRTRDGPSTQMFPVEEAAGR